MKAAYARNRRGFTIIEVVLFLAITSLMMLGIFIGVSGALNRQIYEREVVSLVDFIQGQYSAVDNVRNNRPADTRCDATGIQPSATSNHPGSSSCTGIGRWITSNDDGSELTSIPVYATADIVAAETDDVSEAEYLSSINLTLPANPSLSDTMTHRVDAGDMYVNGDTSNTAFSMLIVKLPLSGMTRTHLVDSSVDTPAELLGHEDRNAEPLRLCIESGRFGAPQSTGVRIAPAAGSVAGVQRIAASEMETQGCV